MDDAYLDDLTRAFPFLRTSPELRDVLLAQSVRKTLAPDQFICLEGDRCQMLPLVLDGTARVYKTSETGREVTLYRINPGETCILTASCILSDLPFPAFATTESPLQACLIPSPTFQQWVDRHDAWRHFTFDLLARRLADVMALVEDVTFRRLDVRLAAYLLAAADADAMTLDTTHEAIALDLGSSREVISRLLNDFQSKGWVRLSRGQVDIVKPEALRRLARRM
jgi:CRP/FNR family transcriptional regulator